MLATITGVLGSMKTRWKFFSPTNFHTKVLSRPVKAMITVRTAGSMYKSVTSTRNGDRKA